MNKHAVKLRMTKCLCVREWLCDHTEGKLQWNKEMEGKKGRIVPATNVDWKATGDLWGLSKPYGMYGSISTAHYLQWKYGNSKNLAQENVAI